MIRAYLNDIVFDWPWVLVLLIGVPVWVWWSIRQRKKNTAGIAATTGNRAWKQQSWRLRLMYFPMWLRGAAVACLIVALAKPAHYQTIEMNNGEGIDIMLCMDVSGSMLARDFKPDRLRASMEVARKFVQGRKGDRIGLVIFSGQSLALCPLTSDLQAVLHQINAIEYGQLADGTSIGTGLASSVDRLRQSKSPGKVVILLTDGEDTGGFFDPATAKQLAMTYGIKVYTIGVGSNGTAPMPYQTPTGTEMREEKVNIDEALLTDIAQSTGGQYFRATNTKGLDSIYASINQLEKNRVESTIFTKRTERFFPWLAAAIVLLILEMLLTILFFKKIP